MAVVPAMQLSRDQIVLQFNKNDPVDFMEQSANYFVTEFSHYFLAPSLSGIIHVSTELYWLPIIRLICY